MSSHAPAEGARREAAHGLANRSSSAGAGNRTRPTAGLRARDNGDSVPVVRSELRLTIDGPPRTKKNHGQIVRIGGHPRLLPSKAWRAWSSSVLPLLIAKCSAARFKPIAYPVNCCALFYRDADRGDAVGFYQGLADILQDGGIVADDKYLMSWDGSRLLKDASRPRVELVLTPIGDRP